MVDTDAIKEDVKHIYDKIRCEQLCVTALRIKGSDVVVNYECDGNVHSTQVLMSGIKHLYDYLSQHPKAADDLLKAMNGKLDGISRKQPFGWALAGLRLHSDSECDC